MLLLFWCWLIRCSNDNLQDLTSRHGYRVTGDVCYEEAIKVVSAITPVPGGVGPVAISMLLSNTLDSAKRAFGFTPWSGFVHLIMPVTFHPMHRNTQSKKMLIQWLKYIFFLIDTIWLKFLIFVDFFFMFFIFLKKNLKHMYARFDS